MFSLHQRKTQLSLLMPYQKVFFSTAAPKGGRELPSLNATTAVASFSHLKYRSKATINTPELS